MLWLAVCYFLSLLLVSHILIVSASVSFVLEPPPKAFFFREDHLAQPKITPTPDFVEYMGRLNGYQLNCLGESGSSWEHVTKEPLLRFKQRYPKKLANVHFAQREIERDVATSGRLGAFTPPHFLYLAPGLKIVSHVSLQAQSVDIDLSGVGAKELLMWAAAVGVTDMAIGERNPSTGKVSWLNGEHVTLSPGSAENALKTGALRINRAAYNSTSRSWNPPTAYIAFHACLGGKDLSSNWVLNYGRHAPRDASNRTASDVKLALWVRTLTGNGPLAMLDGVSFDVSYWELTGVKKRHNRGKPGEVRLDVDVDNDGIADGGYVNQVNDYGLGQFDLHRRIRQSLGPDKVIVAKGQAWSTQRSVPWLNGIEHEGFPCDTDTEILDWGGAINRLLFWNMSTIAANTTSSPNFNHIILKWPHAPPPPWNRVRVVLAAAAVTDAVISIGSIAAPMPADTPRGKLGIWDELKRGDDNVTNWLGGAVDSEVNPRLALGTEDALSGAGVDIRYWLASDGAQITTVNRTSIEVAGKDPRAYNSTTTMNATLALGELLSAGSLSEPTDIVVSLAAVGDSRAPEYPPEIPRLLWVQLLGTTSIKGMDQWKEGVGQQMTLVASEREFVAVFYFRNVTAKDGLARLNINVEGTQPLRVRDLQVHLGLGDVWVREYQHGIVACNPSFGERTIDLRQALPGYSGAIRRLRASPLQDHRVNDGSLIGAHGSSTAMLHLPAMDAVFLSKSR